MGMPGELPDGPVIKTLSELPMPGAWVLSLVRELGSRKLCGAGRWGGGEAGMPWRKHTVDLQNLSTYTFCSADAEIRK